MVLDERQAEDERDREVEQRAEQRRRFHPGLEQRLAADHLHGRPDEDTRAQVDDAGKAVDDLEHDGAAPDDDGHADDEAGDDEQVAAVRRASHGEDIVETHDGVGDHDRPHRAPEGRGRGVVPLLGVRVGQQEPVGDPEQRQAAREQQPGDVQEPDDDHRHQAAHDDGTDGTPDDRPLLQRRRQAARGQGDDDRVVAGEHQVDHDDGEQRGKEGGGIHRSDAGVGCVRFCGAAARARFAIRDASRISIDRSGARDRRPLRSLRGLPQSPHARVPGVRRAKRE